MLCNWSREAQKIGNRLRVAGLRPPNHERVNHIRRDAHHGVGFHTPDTE
jgi:hypothetical protein